jgi:hypothetical protein
MVLLFGQIHVKATNGVANYHEQQTGKSIQNPKIYVDLEQMISPCLLWPCPCMPIHSGWGRGDQDDDERGHGQGSAAGTSPACPQHPFTQRHPKSRSSLLLHLRPSAAPRCSSTSGWVGRGRGARRRWFGASEEETRGGEATRHNLQWVARFMHSPRLPVTIDAAVRLQQWAAADPDASHQFFT